MSAYHNNLPVGTHITMVYPDQCLLTQVVKLEGVYFHVAIDDVPMDDVPAFVDEGVTWIRGHHAPSSPEVSAAVTAQALCNRIQPSTLLPIGTGESSIHVGPPITGAIRAAPVLIDAHPTRRVYRKP